MRPKDVLASNLNRLMQANPHLETNLKIVAQSGGRLSNGKLGRIRLGGKTDIETIGDLADVFGIEPWQLLVEELNPKALPQLTTTPLIEQVRALVAIPASGNSDRVPQHESKDQHHNQKNVQDGKKPLVFGPALTAAFSFGRDVKDGNSDKASRAPKKRRGSNS